MQLDKNMGTTLIRVARNAIDACLSETEPPVEEFKEPGLNQSAGCFVTIHKDGKLRGCIGNFVSEQPLYLEVAQMAVAAATSDPRFYAMNREDIGAYSLDISVLSPLEKIEDINRIEVGTHGIYLEKDSSRGVLLPQVATEQGWDRHTFLEQTCIKAGLTPNAWQSSRTSIYIFSAQIITDH